MALTLTDRAQLAVDHHVKEPNIALEIEGVGTVYGYLTIKKFVQIGDPGLEIGDPVLDTNSFYIGGVDDLGDQENAITLDGTTNQIQQMLQIDLGQGTTIQTMSIALIDSGSITRLITPGQVIDDILQSRCKVYLGFDDAAFPDDYLVIFRGVVTDVTSDAGKTVLTLSHPDSKKQGSTFFKIQPNTVGALTTDDTFVALDSVANILNRILSPDGTYDSSFVSCLLIDDELISFLNTVESRTFAGTVTIATPGVWTAAGHGMLNGQKLQLSTSGDLPTGLSTLTDYYVVNKDTNTFQLALTAGGSAINTTGTQSGTHMVTTYSGVEGCSRGYLNTTIETHSDNSQISTFYRLIGNCVDLALKLMCSTGDQSNYLEALQATNFVTVNGSPVANAIYFENIKITEKYNVQIGDFVTTTMASNGANNVMLKEILDIVDTLTGQYAVIDGVSFIAEDATTGVVGFRSQYDTLPDGLQMINDEVDFDEHLRLQRTFLSSFDYDFYIKDTIDDTKSFLEKEIYLPVACFSLPRKSRCSMGYHIGPIPGQEIKTFDSTNIKGPSKMKLVRTTSRNFYNEVVYSFDQDILTDDFLSGVVTDSETSKAQIKRYNKTFTISSKGLRSTNGAENIAVSQSNRRLKWYQFAAEMLSFGTLFGDGLSTEIGDIIWIDGTDLQLPDIKTGLKNMAGRYFFVQNKKLNLKTGDIQFDCIDTNFSATGRYGLISPSSVISSGTSVTEFTVSAGYYQRYGSAEHKKWTSLVGATVRVRSTDFSTEAITTLSDVSTNLFVVSPDLPFIPSAGMILELVNYDDQALASANLVYVAMANADFPDGKQQFLMI